MLNANPRSLQVTGIIFHGSTSIRSKLDMISEIIDFLIIDVALIKEWNAIKNKINELYKKRNLLAHGAVWGNESGIDYLSGSVCNQHKKSMDFTQVCLCDESFKKMATRLEVLAISVNRYLAKQWCNIILGKVY